VPQDPPPLHQRLIDRIILQQQRFHACVLDDSDQPACHRMCVAVGAESHDMLMDGESHVGYTVSEPSSCFALEACASHKVSPECLSKSASARLHEPVLVACSMPALDRRASPLPVGTRASSSCDSQCVPAAPAAYCMHAGHQAGSLLTVPMSCPSLSPESEQWSSKWSSAGFGAMDSLSEGTFGTPGTEVSWQTDSRCLWGTRHHEVSQMQMHEVRTSS
jgi:hypothetical protein